jgi:kynurenine formamidase
MFDLSHAVEDGMAIFPGDPEPHIEDAGATEPWRVTALHLGSHTGTHIDAASHYIPEATTIDAYPLERFIVSGVVVSVLGLGPDEAIDWSSIASSVTGLPRGAAVALHTGWDTHWGGGEYLSHPYLSDEAARRLVAAEVSLVAIDALNVDSTPQGRATVHEILLGADVLIVENLRGLDQLESGCPFRFAFLPLRLTGLDGSPVRAVAWEDAATAV